MADYHDGPGALLIVEDHEDTRQMLCDFLEQAGYAVDAGADGVEALEKARARTFDVVITDVNMPRVGGLALIESLKREGLDAEVLVLSGDGEIGRAVEAMRLGARNYLVKPVDLDQLLHEVRVALHERRDRLGTGEARAAETGAPAGGSSGPSGAHRARSGPRTIGERGEELPTKIARYQVLSELGAGGMGTIYKCFDPILGRTVAVKVVIPEADPTGQDEVLQRFACEAQAAGMLRHPNIVTIYDYSAEPTGPLYLAMEFLSGPSLATVLEEDGRLPWQRAVHIAFQLADALEFAHRNQVIHRDVKPANIIVLPGDAVKILDFGIAKLANSALTVPGTFVGSPRYLSPESLRGAGIDYRADQFALGSVLYEMLTGKPAFDFTEFYAGIHHVLFEEPPPLEGLDLDLPLTLYDVVERLHQKDADRRYHNEMHLLDELIELGELAGLSLHPAVPRDSPGSLL